MAATTREDAMKAVESIFERYVDTFEGFMRSVPMLFCCRFAIPLS
jgi:hypothetical protein